MPPAAAEAQQQSSSSRGVGAASTSAADLVSSLRDLFYLVHLVMWFHVPDGASDTGPAGALQSGAAAGGLVPTEGALDLCLAAMRVLKVRDGGAAPQGACDLLL